MKILGLYNNECAIELFDWIKTQGHEVVLVSERLDSDWCLKQKFDLTISYTYRFILSADLIEALNNNVINIHNSYLPWNRGADPNLWSIIDHTPRGVSIHFIDTELDKGYIIAQELVECKDDETLKSSYYSLDAAAKSLFRKVFDYYDQWPSMKKKCIGKGSYHSLKDGEVVKSVIDTYDITITEFKNRLNIVKDTSLYEKHK